MPRAKAQQANRLGTSKKFKSENIPRSDGGKFDLNRSRIKRLTDWDQEDILDEQDEFFEGLDKVSLQPTTRDTLSETDLEIPEQLLDIDDGKILKEEEFIDDQEPEVRLKSRKERKSKAPINNSNKGRFGKLPVSEVDDSINSPGRLEEIDQVSLDEKENSEAELEENDSSDEDESTWKSYHVIKSHSKKKKPKSNDVEAIKEEEERRALELAEVKRLQAKARSKLVPIDFSSYLDYASDEELDADTDKNTKQTYQDPFDQPGILVKEFHSEPEAINYLLKTKPECLALLDDLRRSLDLLSELQDELVSDSRVPANGEGREKNQAFDLLHYQVLSTYVSNAAFYMHLSLQVPTVDPSLLSSVMKSLIDLRTTLNLMEQYDLIGDSQDSDVELGSGIFNGQYSRDEFEEELRDLLSDQANDQGTSSPQSVQLSSTGKRYRSAVGEVDLSDCDMGATSSKSKPKRHKKPKTRGVSDISTFPDIEDPNLSLKSLPPRPSKSSILDDLSVSQEENMGDVDFIEASSLTEKERSERAKKKKDLRFYTAKIQAKGKRREKALAGIGGVSGDGDLPYITKEAQRREYIKQQDHQQSRGGLDDEDFQSRDETGDYSNHQAPPDAAPDDYYNTIKELKLSAKKSKKVQYDEQKLLERDALTRSGEIDEEGGPRSINRQILKNKGLTPKRAKENRNPRVKKRKRFDKAQQKISSQRPTFKPDQAAQNRTVGGYQGERTGVKVGLVKSRKL